MIKPYVIIRNEDNAFVATPGDKSYTHDLRRARVFRSEQEAREYGVCGNERVVPASNFLQFMG